MATEQAFWGTAETLLLPMPRNEMETIQPINDLRALSSGPRVHKKV